MMGGLGLNDRHEAKIIVASDAPRCGVVGRMRLSSVFHDRVTSTRMQATILTHRQARP